MSEEPPEPKAKRVTKPKRPPNLPHGRWLGDLGDLSPFENRLVAACARGEVCTPDNWDGKRPEANAATAANTIRAELIRFLALGGDEEHPMHEQGVMLRGVWVKGKLSLHQATAAVRLDLQFCHFDSEPDFTAANLPELVLVGSKVPSLRADRMIVKGGVFLRDEFEASGEVRLLGAKIGGILSCMNSKFSNPEGKSLSADGMVVNSSVFLREGFEASGEVRLLSVQIGGDLDCGNGMFSNPAGKALYADGIVVSGAVFLRSATIEGAIDLTAAQIGTLVDDANCWQAGGHSLDGLNYNQIIGSTDAIFRIKWLDQQHKHHLITDFKPQPWEQLIKTLREMGHPYEAAEVAIAKQKQLRKAGKIKGSIRTIMHWLYGAIAGYGHRPIWTVYWMAAVCMACSLAFYAGREIGVVGPSSPLIHASARFDSCGARGEANKDYWTSANCPMPPEYTTFQPFIYSLDLILPLVDLQQDGDWAPIVSNANGETLWAGRVLRWLMWFEILFGWMASLTLVAVLGRLVDKD